MMPSKILTLLVTACIAGMCAPAPSQAGGGGSGSGASGTGGTAASTSGTATVGTSSTAGTGGLKGAVGTAPSGGTEDTTTVGATNSTPDTDQATQQTHSKAQPGSAAAVQAQRNAGAGTAPNGLPIGASGSGPGSPEQPLNSGRE